MTCPLKNKITPKNSQPKNWKKGKNHDSINQIEDEIDTNLLDEANLLVDFSGDNEPDISVSSWSDAQISEIIQENYSEHTLQEPERIKSAVVKLEKATRAAWLECCDKGIVNKSSEHTRHEPTWRSPS